MSVTRIYSAAEVAEHNTKEDCWIILQGRVLDVTSFIDDHPGGVSQIVRRAGTDVTEIWEQLHDPQVLQEYLPAKAHVGWIEGHVPAEDSPPDTAVDVASAGDTRILVLGHGPVAQNFIEALLKQLKKAPMPHSAAPYHITVFCEELRPAYDRVHMSEFFEHQSAAKLALVDERWYADNGVRLMVGNKAVQVDRERKRVLGSDGEWVSYDRLVFATGSYPFVPPIKGLSVELSGVFVYRDIEDMEGIIAYSKRSNQMAGVIGGGLLGLEVAKATLDLGVETHVLEAAPYLMPVQLDQKGGSSLKLIIEDLGIAVHCGVKILEMVHSGGVLEGVRLGLPDGGNVVMPVTLLVVSCGIRPRDELARDCGIEVAPRGGVVVDNAMASVTDPESVFAIGEVASHDGRAYGLVAPGFEQARCLANNLVADKSPAVARTSYNGSDLSTKLKLMGVDVASFGYSHEFWTNRVFDGKSVEEGGELVFLTQADPFSGYYRKLVFNRDGSRLLGGVCVGDASDYMVLLNLCKKGMGERLSKDLFFGGGALEMDATQLDDNDIVCTCNGVTKAQVCEAVKELDVETLPGLKRETKCGAGCGGCILSTGFVPKIFEQALAAVGKEIFKGICPHFPFSRKELFEIIRIRSLHTFEEVIAAAGGAAPDKCGCEKCKPVCASIFASLWNEHPMKHDIHTLQDTNDYVLGNIQRSGQYSVIPRIPGGEITPSEMSLLSVVSKKHGLWTKITGGQRIALFGANMWDLPQIFKEITSGTVDGELICEGGMESGHAYGKSLRTVKTCVGSSWCRFGQQDSVALGVMLENRYKGFRSPHKIKFGVSGCLRECAEARGKDIGLIATPKGYNLYVCGNGGASPKHAVLLVADIDVDGAVRLIDRLLMYYTFTAGPLIRTSKWLEDMEGGLEHLKAVIIGDKLGLCEELDSRMAQHVATYHDEWLDVVNNPEMQRRFRQFVNVEEHNNGDLKWLNPEYDARPGLQSKISNVDHESIVGPAAITKELAAAPSRKDRMSWVDVGAVDDFPVNGGAAVLISQSQIAVFRHDAAGAWYATQNLCPHKQLQVLSRGILGMEKGVPKVACPIHKNTYKLDSGRGISTKGFNLSTFEVRVVGDRVSLLVPPAAELDELLAKPDPQSMPTNHDCSGGCGDGNGGIADIEDLIGGPPPPMITSAV